MINNLGPDPLVLTAPVASPTSAQWLPVSGVAPATGPSNVAYVVASGGDDATGQIGNMFKPFATIAGALTKAAATLTTINVLCGPGTFAPPGAVPAALTGIVTVAGAGSGITLITTGGDGFALGTTIRNAFVLRGCSLSCGGKFFDVDGTGLAGVDLPGGLLFDDVTFLAGTATIRYVSGRVRFQNCTGTSTGVVTLDTCKAKDLVNSALAMSFIVDDDNDDANKPAGSLGRLMFLCSTASDVTLTAQGSVLSDGGSTLFGTLSGNVMTANAAMTLGPSVIWRGALTTVDFGSADSKRFPNTAVGLLISFTGASITGDFQVGCVAASTLDQNVVADGAYFGSNVTVRFHINMAANTARSELRVNQWSTPDGSGTILPPTFALAVTALGSTSQAVALPFRLPSASYTIAPDLDNATAVYLAVTARSATGFTVAVAIAAGNFRGTLSPN